MWSIRTYNTVPHLFFPAGGGVSGQPGNRLDTSMMQYACIALLDSSEAELEDKRDHYYPAYDRVGKREDPAEIGRVGQSVFVNGYKGFAFFLHLMGTKLMLAI